MTDQSRFLILGLGVLAMAGFTPAAAAAAAADQQPRRLNWSTYLRTGPAETFRVVDELEHDTAVTVGECSGRWCRVSADGLVGFVDKDALDLPAPPAPRPAAETACVVAGQADARAPRPTRFCGSAPPPAPAPPAA